MSFVMFFIAAVYVIVVYIVAKYVVLNELHKAGGGVSQTQEVYQELLAKRRDIFSAKKIIEEKASQIFTLYDMTKEIAKKFSEEEAFKIFRSKLADKVFFEECLLLDPRTDKIAEMKKDKKYFLLNLKGKNALLGYLAIKGFHPDDKEKIVILAHQFALALRRIRLYQEVERLAITDSLTGVHTRRYILNHFDEELKRAQARKIQLSFLMIDVDYFKHFNDQYGHLAGDQILREISNMIQENIREIDVAGRYGGEEFCVVLPDTDRGGAHYVAERIRSSVEKTAIKAYDTTVRATVSVGITTYPHDGKKMEELIDKADWAMYRAKKQGRNMCCAFGVYDS